MHTHTPSTEGANIAMWNIYEQQVEILKSQLATKLPHQMTTQPTIQKFHRLNVWQRRLEKFSIVSPLVI